MDFRVLFSTAEGLNCPIAKMVIKCRIFVSGTPRVVTIKWQTKVAGWPVLENPCRGYGKNMEAGRLDRMSHHVVAFYDGRSPFVCRVYGQQTCVSLLNLFGPSPPFNRFTLGAEPKKKLYPQLKTWPEEPLDLRRSWQLF